MPMGQAVHPLPCLPTTPLPDQVGQAVHPLPCLPTTPLPERIGLIHSYLHAYGASGSSQYRSNTENAPVSTTEATLGKRGLVGTPFISVRARLPLLSTTRAMERLLSQK